MAFAGALASLLAAGCGVERTLRVQSDPPGALVYLNGDEAGRTPMRKTFLWYGTYDVQLRKEGYVTKSEKTRVWAPWWQVPPIDFFVALLPLPLQDNHVRRYRLYPETDQQTDPQMVIQRGERMRYRLQTGMRSRRPPSTQSASQPAGGR